MSGDYQWTVTSVLFMLRLQRAMNLTREQHANLREARRQLLAQTEVNVLLLLR